MRDKRVFVLFFITLFFFSPVEAKILLPVFFSDNMVLQQKMNDAIWGTSNSNAKIEIRASWDKKVFLGTADAKGKWKIFIRAPVAGGPYTIDIRDHDSHVQLKNVLVGEVWFCS